MKINTKITILALYILFSAITASADLKGLKLTDTKVDHDETLLTATVTIDGRNVKLKSNEEILIEPLLTLDDGRILNLTPVIFLGHNRAVQAQRHPKPFDGMIIATSGSVVEASGTFSYNTDMKSGEFTVRVTQRGCCRRDKGNDIVSIETFEFPGPWNFQPSFAFITPQSEGPKSRNLSGRAFVDFRVNRTEIDPQYRQNPRELANINSTIDNVASDPDVNVRTISFTGYASPEGSYANNARLAEGRKIALRDYVRSKYDFPESIYKVSSVPEDWEGLKVAVENSDYPDKEGLLSVITDTSLEPDTRDRKLASKFPKTYRLIKNDIYPALRHCDYEIDYVITDYDDPAKILELIETAPQKLSLREMFVAANTLEPGTDRYFMVFDVAARMFPDSEIANLNAAVSQLQRGSLEQAEYFLNRSGNLPEAVYSRGLLEAMRGNYDTATDLIKNAKEAGVVQADEALKQLEKAPHAGE